MEKSKSHQHKKEHANKHSEQKTLEGVISISSKGVGYLSHESLKEDVEIKEGQTLNALHGDTVKVIFFAKKGARAEGRVASVVKRAKSRFVGVTKKHKGDIFAWADNYRIHVPFLLQGAKIDEGMKVLVELKHWSEKEKYPAAKIIETIGKKGDHNTEMLSIVLDRGFSTEFPAEVEKEAAEVKKKAETTWQEELRKRRDFRNITTFTIDPSNAKDFDDALSFEKIGPPAQAGNLYRIGIHIADVSHFVTPKTILDKEAQKRGTSIYLVDRTIPMLPEILSNDLCSLNPQEEKFVFSAVFDMDGNGAVHKSWFGKGIIKSNKRFTYEEAQEVLDNGGQFEAELRTLNSIAKKLLFERSEKGAISFEQDEVKFELDDKGVPIRVFRKIRQDTNKMIEEFMLLANREVATFINKLKKDGKEENLFLYRIHDVPDYEKIAELSIFVKALGHELPLKDGLVKGKDMNALFKRLEGEAEEAMIKTAAIRSMAKAIYSIKNIGHYGLAFDYYTHFTSPIRRYPDVLVHRLLEHYLAGKKIGKHEFGFYERLASETTEAEIKAADAERQSIKLKQVEFMAKHVGKTFEGIISGVTDWGIYVEEKETKSEGMVKLRDLKDDFYVLDRKNYRLVGERNKKKYSLGDSVKFKVSSADPERKTLDYKLA